MPRLICLFVVDIDPANVHILDGNNPDLYGECAAYEKAIEAAGGIELFLGGIGEDGHIAFNEPGMPIMIGFWSIALRALRQALPSFPRLA